jgi:hypothetical protein
MRVGTRLPLMAVLLGLFCLVPVGHARDYAPGMAAAQPAGGEAGPGNSGSAPGRGGDSPGASGSAPGRGGDSPGASGSAPGRGGDSPGASGSAPGRGGDSPGASGSAPGRGGDSPGASGSAPGRGGDSPGASGSAPGRGGDSPGASGSAPGRGGDSPGASGSAPGRGGDSPGASGSAPGRGGDSPGASGSAPGRGGDSPGASGSAPGGSSRPAPPEPPQATQARPPEPPQAAQARRITPVARAGGGGGDPQFRGEEVSVLGLGRNQRQALEARGFTTIASRASRLLANRDVSRLRTPPDLAPQTAVNLLRQSFPDLVVDLTHLYRPAGVAPVSVRYAHELVGLTETGCAIRTPVGLVDTGIGRHPSLARTRVTERSFVDRRAGGSPLHGTAVASLLVGDLPGSIPLAPGSRLYSANVFAAEGGTLVGDVSAIIEALDWMAAGGVGVVNLSLMGPPNDLLEAAVLAAAQRGLILVAAAGNDGPSAPPAYPAAYPAVIAVAAVDARGRPYANNNRGSYIEIAAPGVDIWAAHVSGGEAFWTGTSFAVPFVTAAIAREVSRGTIRNINDARRFLADSARDLGARGRDPVYGHGLLQARGCG